MDVARAPRSRLGKLAPRVGGGLVAATLLAAGAGVLLRTQVVAAPLIDRTTVWTSRVVRGDLVREVPAQGSLVPEHVEWLSAQTAARVAHIAVRPGAVVEPDTV